MKPVSQFKSTALNGSILSESALFDAQLPINADSMTVEQLRASIREGYEDMLSGNMRNASDAFERFRATRG